MILIDFLSLCNLTKSIIMDWASIFSHLNITIGVLLLAIFFFIQGKIRADLVALCAMLVLLITGVLDTSEALSGFSNNVVIMMAGLFIVGAGIFRTGLAKMISAKLVGLAGASEDKLFVLVLIVTGVIGAFVSNTGTVAVMMPIVMSMVASSNLNPKRYLMPMAFASSMGLFTLISTPPNLVVNQELINSNFPSLSFFAFAPIGLIALSIGVFVLFFTSKWFLSDKIEAVKNKGAGKTLAQLAEDYNLQQSSYALLVPEDSPLVGKTLSDLQIRNRYNISVSKIVFMLKNRLLGRKVEEILAGPDTIILPNATLYCLGEKASMDSFVADNHLTYESHNLGTTSFQEDGIAEAYVLPNSSLVNKTIVDCKFRESYDVNVIGIKRDTDYKMAHLDTYRLKEGDALLVQGTWDHISSLEDRFEDLVVVGKPLAEASKITLDQKAPVTAIIMILMIVAMVSNVVPPVAAVLLACIAIIMTGCLKNMEEAYGSINWSSIVLIASMLPMSIAFEKTGITIAIADALNHYFGSMGNLALLAGIYVSTSLLTIFISNTATAVLFAPIAMKAAIAMEASPVPFMFAVAVAASMCFASPFSTAPNALVMHAGGYRFSDYIKVGLPLQIIMAVVMIFVLPLIYPF